MVGGVTRAVGVAEQLAAAVPGQGLGSALGVENARRAIRQLRVGVFVAGQPAQRVEHAEEVAARVAGQRPLPACAVLQAERPAGLGIKAVALRGATGALFFQQAALAVQVAPARPAQGVFHRHLPAEQIVLELEAAAVGAHMGAPALQPAFAGEFEALAAAQAVGDFGVVVVVVVAVAQAVRLDLPQDLALRRVLVPFVAHLEPAGLAVPGHQVLTPGEGPYHLAHPVAHLTQVALCGEVVAHQPVVVRVGRIEAGRDRPDHIGQYHAQQAQPVVGRAGVEQALVDQRVAAPGTVADARQYPVLTPFEFVAVAVAVKNGAQPPAPLRALAKVQEALS